MSQKPELPEPWIYIETISGEERDRLEGSIGSGLTNNDLDESDVRRTAPNMTEPLSRKSWIVMGCRWVRIRNVDTGVEALLRLQTFDGVNVTISSAAFPMNVENLDMTGSDIRALPVAALAAAFSYDEQAGRANLATFLELMEEVAEGGDPLEELPDASNTAKFSALVARQYRHIEDNEPGAYVAQRMSEINNKPLPSVQRWITQSRKAGFLPPARTGRRPNNG